MRASKLTLLSMLSLGLFGATMVTTVQPTTAQAATTHSAKRSKSVKLAWRSKPLKWHAYYTVRGNRYSAHLGANYGKMSKYPKTTWYADRHEKLIVKKTKKARIYYHIRSSNEKHAGWIWRGYLTSGVNPAAPKFIHKKDKKRVTRNTAMDNDNNNYDLAKIRVAMYDYLNKQRQAVGKPALKYDQRLENMGNKRAEQLRTNYDHYDKDDNLIIAMKPFKDLFKVPHYWLLSEDIDEGDTFHPSVSDEAMHSIESFHYDGSKNHLAHWNDLMSSDYKGVGIGLANKSTGSDWKDQGYNVSIVLSDMADSWA